ncbi:MAG: hypothetical protein ACRCTU_06080, partial [Zoogloea sp.]|uniref:hypothetical protein n=1 Tax=Zoogloea sp. TaxID=49181 RepID=UPI003F3A1945
GQGIHVGLGRGGGELHLVGKAFLVAAHGAVSFIDPVFGMGAPRARGRAAWGLSLVAAGLIVIQKYLYGQQKCIVFEAGAGFFVSLCRVRCSIVDEVFLLNSMIFMNLRMV